MCANAFLDSYAFMTRDGVVANVKPSSTSGRAGCPAASAILAIVRRDVTARERPAGIASAAVSPRVPSETSADVARAVVF
jgi:hypothetical protein